MFESEKRELFDAEGSLEFLTVFDHVFASVPVCEAKIEDFAAVELGDATGSGTEAVGEPGYFGKRLEPKDFQIPDGFKAPRSGNFWRCGGTRQRSAGFAARQ